MFEEVFNVLKLPGALLGLERTWQFPLGMGPEL